KLLRAPAAGDLRAGGGVLRARDVVASLDAHQAEVAADALADRVGLALLDLARDERVCDRRPRAADQVDQPAPHDVGHLVGAGEALDGDDRLPGLLADPTQPLELVVGGREPRWAHVEPELGAGADDEVPEVDRRIGEPDEAGRVLGADPVEPARVDADANGARAVGAHLLADSFDRLDPEA